MAGYRFDGPDGIYDDDTRAVWQESMFMNDPPVKVRDYTTEENAEADARDAAAAATEQVIVNAATLAGDAKADNPRLETAIADLAVLLGDNTVAGSIRQWRAAVTNTYSAASQRALADLLINALQAERRVARAVLRLSKIATGDTTSVDVGPE